MSKYKAIFLDRDGVLNQAIVKDGKPYPPMDLSELIVPADVPVALTELKAMGYLLLVVTNQPDVARGKTKLANVEAINQHLLDSLPLDRFYVCYHDDNQCQCRKPMPGLLLQAANDYEIDLSHSFIIGDRWKDVQAGKNAGCSTILIDYVYNEPFEAEGPPDYIAYSMQQAVMWIKGRG